MVAALGASAACLLDTPELRLEQPWCARHAPDGGRCWDFDRAAKIDDGWTALDVQDLAYARAEAPAHPDSPPNAFQSRIEPPMNVFLDGGIKSARLRLTEDIPNVAKLAFAVRLDPKECTRRSAAIDSGVPNVNFVAYVALGEGTSGGRGISAVFALMLTDADEYLANVVFPAAEVAWYAEVDAGRDAGPPPPSPEYLFTRRPTAGWLDVRIEVQQTAKRTASFQLTVDGEQRTFPDLPLANSPPKITIGLGLSAVAGRDGEYTTTVCRASFDNVTLEIK